MSIYQWGRKGDRLKASRFRIRLCSLNNDVALSPYSFEPCGGGSRLADPYGIGGSNDPAFSIRHREPHIERIGLPHTSQIRGHVCRITDFRRKGMRHHFDITIPLEHEPI